MVDGLAFATDKETTTPETQEGLNFGPSSPVLPDHITTDRANRANFALGDDSPGAPALKSEFQNGNEFKVRQQAASKADSDFQAQKIAKVNQLLDNGASLSAADVDGLVNMGRTPQSNPDTVFEDKFGSKMTNAGMTGEPGTNLVFQSAFNQHPDETTDWAKLSSVLISRKQQLKNVAEEADAAYSALPWVSFNNPEQQDKLGEVAQNFLTFGVSQYAAQRNLLNSGPDTGALLPGTNKLEQIQWLYLQPNPAQILRERVGPGSEFWRTNPGAAHDFIKAAHQFSTSDAFVDNFWGVVDVATAGQLGKDLVAATAYGFGRRIAAKKVTLEDIARGQKAALDVLSESPVPPVSAAKKEALSNAEEVLNQPSTPPKPGYYMPKAGVKYDYEAEPHGVTIQVDANGKPRVFANDGSEIVLSRTPEEGHVRVNVSEPSGETRYTTAHGTFKYGPEGVTREAGSEPQRTIYVNEDDYTRLSQVLDEDKNSRLIEDEKGGWYVNDRDKSPEGKPIRGSKIPGSRVKSEPAEGLYPIHIPEGNDRAQFGDFGARITNVDRGTERRVSFGPEIITQPEKETRKAFADIVKSQAENNAPNTLSRMGMHETAASVSADQQIAEDVGGALPIGDTDTAARRLPTNAQPLPYYNDASSLSWRRAMEIFDEFRRGLGATRVERLPVDAWNVAQQNTKDRALSVIARDYKRVSSDAVRDQKTHWDALTNTYKVETRIGKPDGTLFDTSANADWYRRMQYRFGDAAEIRQEGTKFYLAYDQHFDETQDAVRRVIPLGNTTPKSFVGGVIDTLLRPFGLGRSSANTLSTFQRQQRNVATHAPSYLRGAIEDKAQELNAIGSAFNKTERQELNDILVHNRDYIPPRGSGKDRGFFYDSRADFDTAFHAKFGKLPSDNQWTAYEAYKDLSDLDWVLRESDSMRDKVRQGVRNYRFTFINREGQKTTTDWINGKEVSNFLPEVTQNANIYDTKTNTFLSKYDLNDGSSVSKDIKDRIKSGETKIIQMYNPRAKPMADSTGLKEAVHFVLDNKAENRAIHWGENVEYRPGGHVIYVPQNYVKQPQIGIGSKGKETYFGDVSVTAHNTQSEAERWAGEMNKARDLYAAGDIAGFDNHVTRNLPWTPDELRAKFRDGTFNVEHPFVHVFAGRDALQSNSSLVKGNPRYQGLADTFSAYNMEQTAERAFLQDRGTQLSTIANSGTEANPVWHFVDAPLLDPYSSLGKGLSQIVRSRWMSDMKITSAETWVAEFGHMFDQSKLPLERLRLNPMYYLYHNDGIDKGLLLTNPEEYAAMKTSRDAIIRFIGSKDEFGGLIDGFSQRLVDGISKNVGNKSAQTVEKALPFITSVPQYLRTATFHLADGALNIVQLPQQALGFTHALAISPRNAAHSMTATLLANRMQYTEDAAILGRYADHAASLGWDRDQFLEAYQSWKEGGVHQIGGEVSQRSTFDEPRLFKTAWGSMWDKGLYFFKKGEQINRDVSYFTAYRDWRDANPDRILDNRAKTEIMSRFDTLAMNMTRASNAAYNEGVLSIPTQFMTWNARFGEQMMTFGAGRQLTVGEKSRVLALNSLMFGIPSAVGGAALGAPYLNYDDIRQFAIEKGINLNDKFVQALSKGLPEMALNYILGSVGHEDAEAGISKGVDLHRFSPNADQLRIFSDIQSGKKDWIDLAFGAAGGTAKKLFAASQPVFTYLSSAFSKDGGYPLRMNDLTNAAEIFSSFTNAEKMWVGFNLGKYVSKTEKVQTDVDNFESIALGLGLGLNRVSDAWQMKQILESKKTAQAKIENRVLEDASLMFQALQRGDLQSVDVSTRRIQSMIAGGGFTLDQEKKIWNRALLGNESMIENVNRQWLLNNPDVQDIDSVTKFFNNMKSN